MQEMLKLAMSALFKTKTTISNIKERPNASFDNFDSNFKMRIRTKLMKIIICKS